MTNLTNAYIINQNSTTRKTNDFYPTAPIATLSLLKNHIVPKRIWEPAAGKGHISKELIRNGHEVISTDLYSYENSLVDIEGGVDFMEAAPRNVDGIITNPPYMNNLPQKFIEKGLQHYSFVAIFARLTFMESAKRYELFTKNPPNEILVFSQRIQCSEEYFTPKEKQIGGMVAYAWFIWNTRYKIRNRIGWVKPSDYLGALE